MAEVFFDDETVIPEPAAEPAPPPPPARRVARWLVVTAVIAAVAVLGLGGGALWLRAKIDPSGPPGPLVSVDVPKGASTAEIADLLVARHVITDARVFRLYVKFKGGGPFDAGLYKLHQHSAMGAVIRAMAKGPLLPPAVNITVPEGFILAQVAERVARGDTHLRASAFLAAAASGDVRSKFQPPGQLSLEGLLLPETYRVEDKETELDVLTAMVRDFESVAASLGYDEAPQKVGYSAYQTIIVASLVETEAKADADRARIARVIYNRLAKGMALGIDSAFYYTLPLDRRGTALRQSDLDRDTPYNTRLHTGLVPTPIAMPGRASLEAALNPEPGPWLYYVLQDHRTHVFSSDYQQFLRDKKAAQDKGLIP